MGLKVLVTGCAGFIGSNVCERLLARGYQVIGIDSFTNYYSPVLKQFNVENLMKNPSFALIRQNILEIQPDRLMDIMKMVDFVIHEAARPGVGSSWYSDFDEYVRDNILATQRLLVAARDGGVKRFVYASSSSIYGNALKVPTPEDTTPRPFSPYGVTKLAAEHLCNVYHENYRLPVVVLRYFTVYGSRQRPDMAIHNWARAILKGEPIRIYGDGNQTRDFTYVNDIVEGTIRAIETDGIERELLNLGGGSRISVNESVKTLIDILGASNVKVVYDPPKPGDVRHTCADISKARKILGYNPEIGIREGLELFIEWYKQNRMRIG